MSKSSNTKTDGEFFFDSKKRFSIFFSPSPINLERNSWLLTIRNLIYLNFLLTYLTRVDFPVPERPCKIIPLSGGN